MIRMGEGSRGRESGLEKEVSRLDGEGEGGSRGRERWGDGERDKEGVDQHWDKEREEGERGGGAREGTW